MNWNFSPKCRRISACHWRTSPLGATTSIAPRHAAQLQFAQDQPGLDGLAQAHLVRQQVANAVAGSWRG